MGDKTGSTKVPVTGLSQLVVNANESLERKQKGLFNRLIFECLLPFYSELEKMGALQDINYKGVDGLKPPPCRSCSGTCRWRSSSTLIMGSASAAESAEDGKRRSMRGTGELGAKARTVTEANAARRDAVYMKVMKPSATW